MCQHNESCGRLEEIESRLAQNERRTDEQLRQLKTAKEEQGRRRQSELGSEKVPTASTLAGLRRSATDFFRLKRRTRGSGCEQECRDAPQVQRTAAVAVATAAATPLAALNGVSEDGGTPVNRQTLDQRLHQKPGSVFRAAASRIPSCKLTCWRTALKASDSPEWRVRRY